MGLRAKGGAARERGGDVPLCWHQGRHPLQDEAEQAGGRAACRQVQGNACLQFDDPPGDLDQPIAQCVELGAVPRGASRQGSAQRPYQPVGGAMQEKAELVGGGLGAGRAVGGKVGLPALMWFSAWPRAQ